MNFKKLFEQLRVNSVEAARFITGGSTATPDTMMVRDENGDAAVRSIEVDGLWDDMQVAVEAASGAALLTLQEYRDTDQFMYFWRHDQPDTLSVSCQMTHRWQPGTSVKFHLHTIPMSAGSGNVVFDYAYTVLNVGDAAGALATWTTGQATRALAADNQYEHTIVPMVTIPMTDKRESCIILLHLTRNSVADTYQTAADGGGLAAANLALLSLDFHFQIEKLGTVLEFPGAPS